ncbi:ABC transporter [Mycobacterium sp. 21AC1]|uniref:ABC transporter n=1 Tax=[Mycobacterium] appelbergii TaxID=2939269 RepID=UPI0029391763|nr:ABC transporter [Mycobacterium sp. 21AC1]MDV3128766.1 ABC transporter [Mycobacterium sp. 21AC1]
MRTLSLVLAAVLVLAGCAPAEKPAVPATSAAHDDTGIDARESADPVTRLVLVEPGTGATVVYDAGGETEESLGEFGPTGGVSGDGRFAYLHGETGLTIVDAGSWTFDHGDHSHYYVMAPGVAGTVDGRVERADGQRDLTALRRGDGTVEVLDRKRLGEHHIASAAGFDGLRDAAAVMPLGADLVAVTPSGAVNAITWDGARQTLGQCPGVTGSALVSGAVVFGCADGAVKISKRAGKLVAQQLPFGNGGPTVQPGPLVHRHGGMTLAAIAGDDVWVLNAKRGDWASVRIPGAVAVNTISAESVLALTEDGQLRAFDVPSGTQTGALQLFSGPVSSAAPVIEVDADRAYINDVAARAVYEIDYADPLRLARTLKTSVAPGFMVETGR